MASNPVLAWYVSSVGYAAVAKFVVGATYAAGTLVKQTAPASGDERVFACTVGGVAGAEPAWVLTRGAINASGACSFQECTGHAAVNGDATDTYTWTQLTGGNATTVALGTIIQRNNGASIWIAQALGNTAATEPNWASNNAGQLQGDGTVTWICLGPFSSFHLNNAPHARIGNALASGWYDSTQVQSIWVPDSHSESAATINWSPSGTAANFGSILCYPAATTSGPPTSLSTGATVISTVGAAGVIVATLPNFYVYGLILITGQGATDNNTNDIQLPALAGYSNTYDNCQFRLQNAGPDGINNGSRVLVGSNNQGSEIVWNNCTVFFGAFTQFIAPVTVNWRWSNTPGGILATGSKLITGRLISFGNVVVSTLSQIFFEGLNLTQLTGNNLFNFNTTQNPTTVIVKDCSLPSGVSFTQPIGSAQNLQLLNSDNAATNYVASRYAIQGIETTELGVTRFGGAQDPSGRAQSRKLVTPATGLSFVSPFRPENYALWNNTVLRRVAVTIFGTWQASRTPFNDEIWMDIEYLGTLNSTLGVFTTTAKASVVATHTAYARDSSQWNGGGSGSAWSPFFMQAVLDNVQTPFPQFAGLIWVRVRAAALSATFYVDPKIVLS